MIAAYKVIFFSLCYSVFAAKPNVDPEHLNMLRETGRHEEFAKLLGIEDVSLVHPLEGRTEEDLMFNDVSPLGDILLTPEQEEQARQGINFMRFPSSKWKNNEIYYEIGRREFTSSQRTTIESAIKQLNSSLQNVKIFPRTNQNDYVYIMNGKGCYSYLGRTGGQQALSLQATGCLRPGTVMHEMIHALGMVHEQSRPDRDESVTVLYENIPSEWRSQYQKVSTRDYNIQGPYDPYSVMHYPYRAPGTGKPAFKFHDPSVNTALVGQRTGPSNTDKLKVDTLYSN